ncbi:hypothetical protein JTB14_004421 [Gonioctena quinquepunctata]|nr:hypothetical protein JTB14_004421 [Gonioctena quinquepunctata]
MASELEKAVRVLKEEIIKNRKEIKSAIEASESKLLLKIAELNHRVNNLEAENTILNNKIEALEITTKKNYIIIFGLEDSGEVSPSTFCKDIKKLLDVDVHISDLNNLYRSRNPPKTTAAPTEKDRLKSLRSGSSSSTRS